MSFNPQSIKTLLKKGELRKLFIEELGWDGGKTTKECNVDGNTYQLIEVAQKAGFKVWLCNLPSSKLPQREETKKVHSQLVKESFEQQMRRHGELFTPDAISPGCVEVKLVEPELLASDFQLAARGQAHPCRMPIIGYFQGRSMVVKLQGHCTFVHWPLDVDGRLGFACLAQRSTACDGHHQPWQDTRSQDTSFGE